MKLLGATGSDVGNVREANQDRVFFRGMVAALADGMGGHQGGERAAELAIGEFRSAGQQLSESDLVAVVMNANRQVHGHAADNGLPGMGTTVVALTMHEDQTITVANVGDSRAYWLRGDCMSQITEDHSFVEDLVRQGRLTPEEAATHPQRNILTRAVGIGAEVEVDRFPIPAPEVGDRFLLCSDGLFNELSEDEILRILNASDNPSDAAAALIAATLETPCRDNVTVAVVDVVADDDPRLSDQSGAVESGGGQPITAPIPVVSNGDRGNGVAGEGGTAGGGSPTADQAATGRIGTLLLDGAVAEADDPERYLDTAELEIVEDRPMKVRPKSRVAMGMVSVVLVTALAIGGFFLARSYAASGYFIAEESDSGELVIFEGRRGGFLGFDPVRVADTGQTMDRLAPAERAAVASERFSSLREAEELIAGIVARQAAAADLATSSDPAETSKLPESSQTTQGSSGGSTSSADG